MKILFYEFGTGAFIRGCRNTSLQVFQQHLTAKDGGNVFIAGENIDPAAKTPAKSVGIEF